MVISSPIAFKSHGGLQEHKIPESLPEKTSVRRGNQAERSG
jgi:hypothetical protein